MGQAESKESDHNPNQAMQHPRRNTVHGIERSRRPTPPIANSIAHRPTETKRTPTTPRASSPQQLANTPRTFPRSRGLTNVRPRMTPSAAPQRQAATTVRTSGRLQQQFAIRPAKTAVTSASSPILPTPSRSQPIPISRPSTRSRPERAVEARGRPTVRRSAPQTKVAAQATDSDLEPTGPPAKRVTRSRTGLSGVDKTAADPAPAASTTTAAAAIAGPSGTKKQPRNVRPSVVEPAPIGDVEPDPVDRDDKMSVGTDSDGSDDESDGGASHSSDDSEDVNELHADLELDGSDDDNDEKSETSEEKSDVSDEASGALPVLDGSYQPAQRPASCEASADEKSEASEEKSDVSDEASDTWPVSDGSYQSVQRRASREASAGAQFQLRRSRRRSVPVRHLQVDPHRISYISV